jgi:hypothetical protein
MALLNKRHRVLCTEYGHGQLISLCSKILYEVRIKVMAPPVSPYLRAKVKAKVG